MSLITATVAFCAVLGVYQNRESRSHHAAYHALEVVNAVRTIDSIEWRATSGESVDEALADLKAESASLNRLIREGGGTAIARKLGSSSGEYVEAVQTMLLAIKNGETGRARTIDADRVDPQFEELIAAAQAIVAQERAKAEATERAFQLLARATTFTLLSATLLLGHIAFGLRERSLKRRLLVESEDRFRSVVEGSRDVFTVVSSPDDIVVLNRDAGLLAGDGAFPKPGMLGLVSGHTYETWERCDHRLRDGSGSERFEFDRTGPDGSDHHFEAIGSQLGHDSQTVWVWRDITDRRRLETELNHRAVHDPLTGLPNRALYGERVNQELSASGRSHERVAVLFCDLDDFKMINDTLGHNLGDELLRQVANRLLSCVRNDETVARLGGDEFAVIVRDASLDAIVAVAERMISAVGERLLLGNQHVYPSVSIGVAISEPGDSSEDLLRNADLAMYAAKRSGKRRLAVFDPSMHVLAVDLLSLKTDLVAALDAGQFRLLFQPTYDLASGTLEGMEALLRWDHPTRGPLVPGEFLHAAESSGMITTIGAWVLEQACRAGVGFEISAGRPVKIAVNISPQQLRERSFVDDVLATVSRTGLRPQNLVLEVSESILLDNRLALEPLERLRSHGIDIAVDDFGTGYNLINHLQRLPISSIKIDRSFVSGDAIHDEHRHAFLGAMVGLAASLDLQCTAEGIESVEQAQELRLLGCQAGQGYLWSEPTALAEATRQFDSSNVATGVGHAP